MGPIRLNGMVVDIFKINSVTIPIIYVVLKLLFLSPPSCVLVEYRQTDYT